MTMPWELTTGMPNEPSVTASNVIPTPVTISERERFLFVFTTSLPSFEIIASADEILRFAQNDTLQMPH